MTYRSYHDLMLDVPFGRLEGYVPFNAFGMNSNVLITAQEDVWDGGGIWVPPTTARIHDIVSTSADDSSGGTGVTAIFVGGLDTNWLPLNEIISMNGTTTVPTVNAYLRIVKMYATEVGSGGEAAGDITATAQVDSTVTAQITAGTSNETLMAISTVPDAQDGYIARWCTSINRGTPSGSVADVGLLIRDGDSVNAPWRIQQIITVSQEGATFVERQFAPYFKVDEHYDITVRVLSVSANNTSISVGFDGIMVQKLDSA